jgi:hypothetical protein
MTDKSFSIDMKTLALLSGLVLAVVYIIAIAIRFVYLNYVESNDDDYHQQMDFNEI